LPQNHPKGFRLASFSPIAATLPTRACCYTHAFQTFAEVDRIEIANSS
jgi:hypothetical protein